jgi:SagB-type dehydrogenase family enzyme
MSHYADRDIARLYHLNSANLRPRIARDVPDQDRHPLRFRTYPGSPRMALPAPTLGLNMALGAALSVRRSVRSFDPAPLPLDVVGALLYAGYGLRGYHDVDGQLVCDRPTPSAGGLYPLELYVAAQSVAGIDDGVYHFDARAHQLEQRRVGSIQQELVGMAIGQDMIRDANLVIAITAVFGRTMWKYGQRGYRYVLFEAGHVGQNLYLAAAALGLGAVAIGGFFDDEINSALLLPADEEAIYLYCIGMPPGGRAGVRLHSDGS